MKLRIAFTVSKEEMMTDTWNRQVDKRIAKKDTIPVLRMQSEWRNQEAFETKGTSQQSKSKQ